MRTATFYCLRYFLVSSGNIFSTHLNESNKRQVFEAALFKDQDIEYRKNARYAITGLSRDGTLVFGKLAKRKSPRVPERVKNDIEEVPREQWPYVNFVADTEHQLIAVESKSTVINDVDAIARVLTRFVDADLFGSGIAVHFEPLVDPNAFWEFVSSLESVYQVEFDLSAPNMFGASVSANEALAQLKQGFNITSARTTLENVAGQLDLQTRREQIDSYREYADSLPDTFMNR
jgi:hypothetical protein